VAPARGTLLLAFVLLGLACTETDRVEPDRLGVGECTMFVEKYEECPSCIGVELRRGGKGEYFNYDVRVGAKWTVEDDEVVVKTAMNERRYRIADDGALVGPDEYQNRYQRRPCE
jgi:hypothetical protein